MKSKLESHALEDRTSRRIHQTIERLVTIVLAERPNSNGHPHGLFHAIAHRVAEIHSQRGVNVAYVQIAIRGHWHLGHRGGVVGIALLWLLPFVGGTRILADATRARLTTRMVRCELTQKLKRSVCGAIAWLLSTPLLRILVVASCIGRCVWQDGRLAWL
jgi:hypothetical protein